MKNRLLKGWSMNRRLVGMRTISALTCVAASLFLGIQQGRAAASICGSITANLVTNCGFETDDFTGWSLSGNDVPGELNNLYGVEGQDPIDLIFPNSGSYQAYIADFVSNATTLSQTLTTVPGGEYTVSLYLAQDTAPDSGGPGFSNEFDATLDGITLEDVTDVAAEGYTEYSDTVDVTDSSSALDITLGNDLGEFLLDDVSVVATPEPSAWTLSLGGVSLLGFAFRRKLGRGR
jgi:hypothetical protein